MGITVTVTCPYHQSPPKKKEEKSKRKDREERGGWRTPSPSPEQKIETVISSRPKPAAFERNKTYESDSDSSFTSEEEEKVASKKE